MYVLLCVHARVHTHNVEKVYKTNTFKTMQNSSVRQGAIAKPEDHAFDVF